MSIILPLLYLLGKLVLIIGVLGIILFVVLPRIEAHISSPKGRGAITVCAMLSIVIAMFLTYASFLNLAPTPDVEPTQIIILDRDYGFSGGDRNQQLD